MKASRFALVALVAATLSGCASNSIMQGLTPEQGVALTAEQRAANLATLKEVNRHIEQCTRTYAWPFTASWSCPGAAQQGLTAEQIAKIVSDALVKTLAELGAARPEAP